MEVTFTFLSTSTEPYRGKVNVVNLSADDANATYDFELAGNVYTFILNGGGRESHTVVIDGNNMLLTHSSGFQRDYLTRK